MLPLVSNSERTVRPHCLWGGCGSRSCQSIPPRHPMGSAILHPFRGQSTIPLPYQPPASLLADSWGGIMGGREGFYSLQAICSEGKASEIEHVCISVLVTVRSLICICLVAWGKNARTLEKPWIFGVGVVMFVFLVVQRCPDALVGIHSQNRSWF